MQVLMANLQPWARLTLVVSAVAGMIIAIWLVAQVSGWDENRVLDWIPESTAMAAFVIIVLLVADTVLPIPATIVMLGSGLLLGPVGGAVVNGIGLLLAAVVGYQIGRFFPSQTDQQRSMRPMLIAMTRGLPVLSESFAIGAGVIGVPMRQFLYAAASGAAAVGAIYSVAGWLATNHWSLVFVACAIAAASYLSATRLMAAP